jgi:GNAT superfamily N-acetyltransferase
MVSPKTSIRLATTADIPGMSAVRLAVRENRLSNPGRITPEMYADHLGPLGRSWVGECNGQVVGFSAGALPRAGHHASIWALFVLPEFEGLGLGKQLLARAVEWLFSEGAERIVLGTAPGTRADGFYARLGWRRGELRDAQEVEFTLDRPAR